MQTIEALFVLDTDPEQNRHRMSDASIVGNAAWTSLLKFVRDCRKYDQVEQPVKADEDLALRLRRLV
jgi:hypothetical protein